MADIEKLRGWLTGRLPTDWFTEAPQITVDRDEVIVVGRIPEPEVAEGVGDAERAAAYAGAVKAFRELTREARIEIARELEHKLGRAVAWGVECGDRRELFTTHSVPVMTRLRQPERIVLDTLVEGGVARSRSDALAWCVRLVGKNADTWLGELREALQKVGEVRATGP
jgi:hypothetical protein